MLLLPLLLATLPIAEPAEPRPQDAAAEAPVEAGAPDAALVGHYYLSGVMETGSELLLRADGTYDWYISYGAVDLFSDGTWGRRGDAVVLLARKRATASPLFQADEQSSWAGDAEARLLQRQADRRNADIARLCPWDVATASAPSIRLDGPAPTDEDRARAAASLTAAAGLLDQANRLILASVQEPANDASRTAASEAVDRWYEAVNQAERAHEDAGLPMPEFGKPVRPAQCKPARAAEVPAAPGQWQRGVAVLVGDPARRMRLRARAKGLLDGLEAQVDLAVDVMLPSERLAAILSRFADQYPTVTLRLHVEALGAISAMVLDGTAALGMSGPLSSGIPNLDSVPAGMVTMVPVASPRHPLAQLDPVPIGAARDHVQLVLTDRSRTTEGRDFSVISARTWRLADLGAKHALLREGIGWGNMPLEMIEPDLASGVLVRLPLPDHTGGLYRLSAVWRTDSPPGPAAAWLLQQFVEAGRADRPGAGFADA